MNQAKQAQNVVEWCFRFFTCLPVASYCIIYGARSLWVRPDSLWNSLGAVWSVLLCLALIAIGLATLLLSISKLHQPLYLWVFFSAAAGMGVVYGLHAAGVFEAGEVNLGGLSLLAGAMGAYGAARWVAAVYGRRERTARVDAGTS